MAGLFGDLNIDPLTLGLFGMAAGFGSAPRGLGPTLGGGFGGLAQGLTLGQKYQMQQAEMDYKRAQEAREQQKLEMERRQQENSENWWKNFLGSGASPTGLPVAPSGAAPSVVTAPPVAVGDGPTQARAAYDYYIKAGWQPHQAAALAAQFKHESNFNPTAVHDGGIGFGALGWNGDRRARFAEVIGKPIEQSTLEDQYRYFDWELRNGPEKRAGTALQMAQTPEEAGAQLSRLGVRPRDVEGQARARGQTAAQFFAQFNRPQPGADGGAPQQSAPAVADPSAGAYERARALMARAQEAAIAESRGLIKPGISNQLRAMAEMEIKRAEAPVERVTDEQGRQVIIPRSQAVGRVSYGDAPSGYQWVKDGQGNITGLRPLQGGPAEFIIQEVQGPNGQMMRYAIPRASLTGAPAAPVQQGAMPAPAAPALAQAPVNLQAPGAPAPSWAPSGSVLQAPERQGAALPPGAVPLGAAGPANNNPAGLEGSTKKEVEGALLESQNAIAGVNRIRELFRPEFMQTGTRLSAYWSATKDKLPGVFGSLDQASKAQLEDFTRFRSAAWQQLNGIIKDQSGAAVTVPEMERMLRAQPNPGTGVFDGDSPTEFKSKMDEVLELKQRAALRNAWALRRGMNPLESGVTLDQVPKIMAEEINKAQREIAAQNPDMTPTAVLAAARRKVGMELGLGALR